MNVNYMLSFIIVLALCLLSYLGGEAPGLRYLFGIAIPYLAIVIFIFGFISRVMGWARSAVPFRIPTTCGQQKSLPWIKPNRIDNPFSKSAVILRMILEIVCFRSLFRNTRMAFKNTKTGMRIAYDWEIFLWVAALAFHYTFLVVLLRHLRFFFDPVPFCIQILEFFDGFLKIEFLSNVIQVGLPGIYISGVILLAAVTFLFLRRIFSPKVRYISLPADFFPLFLIMGIAITGIMMRYFTKVDIVGIKEFTMGLVSFSPALPEGVGGLFYVHIFLVSVLLAYFPSSKLMHLGGIFLSPTRNMTADTRATRHVNPWNHPVKVHTYEQYEDEFREKMIEAGLPVEKKE
ncbi:MAG: sulfate reduction electron transfer complex DsrMKJOP subunit DsrM [Desulfobacterales bacterium]|nr:sulfate reduction electron transfer complex DsrMKJOP subunit DsrM [Desulfobacterales bacterium]